MENEKIDVLNREDFINKLKILVEILADKKQGCCFGIDGAWGSGKSFVLEMFEEQLKDIQLEETNDNKYFVFHYDCWKYDYYEEPAIAIISAMQDVAKDEISLFTEDTAQGIKVAWKTVEKTLEKIAGEFCKNKIGVDLVDIAKDVLKENDEQKDSNKEFDKLYGFKRALQSARENIQEIAKNKTVVIVVDELDRCLPTYSIKVLERLHHIFVDIDNVIIIVSMDKSQLEHSIKEIYGNIEVDTYLRKFISFKVNLDNGITSSYTEKFPSYFSMFDFTAEESKEVEEFLSNILVGLDMRTQERIFNKAEIIHTIIKDDNIKDCSILMFEMLYLTIAFRTKRKHLRWLSKIWSATYGEYQKILGEQYYNMLNEYGKKVRTSTQHNGDWVINDTLVGKTFFWLANIYASYNEGVCKPYFYQKQSAQRVELVHRFAELVDIVDSD